LYRTNAQARKAANDELKQLPEYWNEDSTPRRELNIASSCFQRIVPAAGGVFLYFRSNPEKGYFYPAGGTTEATAKQVAKLVEAPSLGQAYWHTWAKRNAAPRVYSKSGKSYSYSLGKGKTLDISKKGKIGQLAEKYAPSVPKI
jgi:hypothetical protein